MAPSKKKQTSVEVDEVVQVAQAILLSESPYEVVQRLSSGTVRRDKLQATAEEKKAARADARRLRELRCTALGSNLDNTVDEEDLNGEDES